MYESLYVLEPIGDRLFIHPGKGSKWNQAHAGLLRGTGMVKKQNWKIYATYGFCDGFLFHWFSRSNVAYSCSYLIFKILFSSVIPWAGFYVLET